MKRGFTIVEIIVTITIMAILLTLAVVNVTSSEANARDAERKADMESLALNLESFYKNVDPSIPLSGSGYPNTTLLTDATITSTLPDIDPKSVRAPGVTESDPISVVAATNNVQTITGVTPLPTSSSYVYQPLSETDALCTTGACRKFNIFYFQETTNTVVKIESRNQ